MPKKILLIESDAELARDLTSALEQKGFEARVTGDGKEGLDLARDEQPAAIVLSVELPKMSGYSICNKLKKDEHLKSIPLVIVSAEATAETFEQHKKLKTRAEDYLIKPFDPLELVNRLSALVGAPEPGADEEVVTLADVELEALGGEMSELATLEVEPGSEPAPTLPDEDEDLRLLDDAFENISGDSPRVDAEPDQPRETEDEEILAAAASLREPEDVVASTPDIDALGDEADAALAALGAEAAEDEAELSMPPFDEPGPAAPPLRAASAEALRAAGIRVLVPPTQAGAPPAAGRDGEGLEGLPEKRPGAATPQKTAREAESAELRARVSDLETRLAAAESAGRQRDAELQSASSRMEALSASVKRLEADLKASREEARRAGERAHEAEKQLAAARERAEDAERAVGEKGAEAAEALSKFEALAQELDAIRIELAAARNEVEGARGDTDRRTAELRRQVQELESANAKNEERVVRAYQKIKGDEKLREKTRKALTIALQLLDEHGPVAEPAPDKDRPPPTAVAQD